ncbi:MAG: YbaN family protein [Planctomycetaceae bacterium]
MSTILERQHLNASNTNLPDSNANAAICPQLNELSPSSADSLSGTGRHPLQNDVNSNRLTGIRRYLAIAGAFLCLTLALLGVVIPGLPTTPFVLLASGLFLRSSPGLHRMLRRNRIFGRVIDDWECRRAVRMHVKVLALAIVVVCLGCTLTMAPVTTGVRTAVAAMGCVGIIVIGRIPQY